MNAPDRNSVYMWPALNADESDSHADQDQAPAFRVSFYKPEGRPAAVSASRVLARAGGGGFTYIINYRKKAGEFSAGIAGAATATKIAAAFLEVHTALIAGGYIAADTPAPGGTA